MIPFLLFSLQPCAAMIIRSAPNSQIAVEKERQLSEQSVAPGVIKPMEEWMVDVLDASGDILDCEDLGHAYRPLVENAAEDAAESLPAFLSLKVTDAVLKDFSKQLAGWAGSNCKFEIPLVADVKLNVKNLWREHATAFQNKYGTTMSLRNVQQTLGAVTDPVDIYQIPRMIFDSLFIYGLRLFGFIPIPPFFTRIILSAMGAENLGSPGSKECTSLEECDEATGALRKMGWDLLFAAGIRANGGTVSSSTVENTTIVGDAIDLYTRSLVKPLVEKALPLKGTTCIAAIPKSDCLDTAEERHDVLISVTFACVSSFIFTDSVCAKNMTARNAFVDLIHDLGMDHQHLSTFEGHYPIDWDKLVRKPQKVMDQFLGYMKFVFDLDLPVDTSYAKAASPMNFTVTDPTASRILRRGTLLTLSSIIKFQNMREIFFDAFRLINQ